MDSQPQIIRDRDGRPAFAVLPIAEYEALVERADETLGQAAFDAFQAAQPETFPEMVADRLIAGEHPVRVFREYRGLSQIKLAKQAGTTQVTVSQIETGKRIGSPEMLGKIAAILKVSVDDSWYGL